MRIEPTKLQRLLELASISKGGKSKIEELLLDFKDDGVYVANRDAGITMLAFGMFKKDYFESYDPIGEVKLRANDMLNRLSKSFKGDKTIELIFKDGKVTLTGKNEVYEEKGLEKVETSLPFDTVKRTQYGYITEKADIAVAYKLEITQLDNIGTDRIRLNYSDSEIKAEAKSAVSSYVRKLEYTQKSQSAEGEVILDVEKLQRVVELLAGPVWLVLTQEPVSISYLGEDLEITYIIAPIKGM